MASVKVIVKQNNAKLILSRLPRGRVVAGLLANSGSYDTGESVVEVGFKNEYGVEVENNDSGRHSTPYKGTIQHGNKARGGAITYQSPRGNTVTVRGIPERSFMRSTFGDEHKKWAKDVADNIPLLLEGISKPDVLIGTMGAIMEKAIKDKIIDIHEPPNSPQVIADKGSDNPLIDTGKMIQSIAHEVRND